MDTTSRNRIVAGVDGRVSSLAAVDFAAAEAKLRGASLLLLSACPRRGAAGPHTTLTAILRRVCTAWPGLRITARNITGDPTDALITASRGASMLVVGREEDPELPAGSVGLQVAAHALSPTVVVPVSAPVATDGPVLLGLGMTPEDEPAMAFAFEEASLRAVPLLATHVWSGVPGSALGPVDPFAYDVYRARDAADRLIAEAVAGWAEKYPDVKVDRMPLYDVHPAHTLLDAGALAGLVVVGARRYGYASSQLLGMVPRTLLRRGSRPVVVVRPVHRM